MTDKFGGRIVFFILMLATVVPIWLIAYATEFWHFLVLGLFVGLAGGSFTVGIALRARAGSRNAAGLRHGHIRRRQFRGGGDQARRAELIVVAGTLGDGAEGLCRRSCW